MTRRIATTIPKPRFGLRALLAAVALMAFASAWLVPVAKKTFFPGRYNTWIVRTESRPDGSVVRVRIRRHPDRDEIHEEVLIEPQGELEAPFVAKDARPGPNTSTPAH